MIAMLIWAYRSTSGTGGPIMSRPSLGNPPLTGSTYSYAWLSAMTSMISSYATLTLNMPDFSRYSHVKVRWQVLYVPMLPAFFTFVAFIGLAITSAGEAHYGAIYWNPADLMSRWNNRAAQFFAAAAMVLASIGLNVSANSLSAANDLSALFPRYINIRRGQLACALIAWVMAPWKILESSQSFLNFMSAYAVFLGPIAAILACDFWWLHGAKYDVVALYHPNGYVPQERPLVELPPLC